jgi:hypothetical protein
MRTSREPVIFTIRSFNETFGLKSSKAVNCLHVDSQFFGILKTRPTSTQIFFWVSGSSSGHIPNRIRTSREPVIFTFGSFHETFGLKLSKRPDFRLR